MGGGAVGCLPSVAACLSPQPGTPVQTCLKRRGPFGAGVQAQDPALPDGRSIGWKNLKLGEKARDEVGTSSGVSSGCHDGGAQLGGLKIRSSFSWLRGPELRCRCGRATHPLQTLGRGLPSLPSPGDPGLPGLSLSSSLLWLGLQDSPSPPCLHVASTLFLPLLSLVRTHIIGISATWTISSQILNLIPYAEVIFPNKASFPGSRA